MDIDGILAIAVFILIISWSFTFYYGLFSQDNEIQRYTIDTTANRIMNYISVDVYDIPVIFSSTQNLTNEILYFKYEWEKKSELNSVQIWREILEERKDYKLIIAEDFEQELLFHSDC